MEEIIDEKTFYTDWNEYWVELIRDDEKQRNTYTLRVFRWVEQRWLMFTIKKKEYCDEEDFNSDEIDFVPAAQEFVRKLDRHYRELAKWRRDDGYVSPPAGDEWILEEPEPILVNDWQSGQQYEIQPDWQRKHGDQSSSPVDSESTSDA